MFDSVPSSKVASCEVASFCEGNPSYKASSYFESVSSHEVPSSHEANPDTNLANEAVFSQGSNFLLGPSCYKESSTSLPELSCETT